VIGELADVLHTLMLMPSGPAIRAQLARSHPFAIQGAIAGPIPFLIVDDPELEHPNRCEQLARLNNGQPCIVWVDLSRLRSAGWRDLPPAMICFVEGKQRILWNYHADLSPIQIKKLGTHAYMIHQYANRAADLWKQITGRRPEVHAGAAASLNYRPPQLLIDPRVDLASVPYRLFSHNHWILPVHGRPPEFTNLLGDVEECEQ
jgi:hypothetical protein